MLGVILAGRTHQRPYNSLLFVGSAQGLADSSASTLRRMARCSAPLAFFPRCVLATARFTSACEALLANISFNNTHAHGTADYLLQDFVCCSQALTAPAQLLPQQKARPHALVYLQLFPVCAAAYPQVPPMQPVDALASCLWCSQSQTHSFNTTRVASCTLQACQSNCLDQCQMQRCLVG